MRILRKRGKRKGVCIVITAGVPRKKKRGGTQFIDSCRALGKKKGEVHHPSALHEKKRKKRQGLPHKKGVAGKRRPLFLCRP